MEKYLYQPEPFSFVGCSEVPKLNVKRERAAPLRLSLLAALADKNLKKEAPPFVLQPLYLPVS